METAKQFAASRHRQLASVLALVFMLAYTGTLIAQQDPGEDAPKSAKAVTITVRVVGGEAKIPIAGARLYIRSEKDDAELTDAKTNSKGMAVIEGLPRIRVRIQVTATDWMTRGLVVDLADPKLTLQIEIVLSPSDAK